MIGPGLFLVGYNIGTGSITTMAAAGADHGMGLVWPLVISCVFTFAMIITFGRYTAITGETALHSFRKHFGAFPSLFVLVSLLLSEFASSIGVMAVICESVQEWSRPLTESGEGFNTVVLAAIFGGILYALILDGRYSFFEKILTLFVGLMGLSFVLTMFMVIPSPGDVLAGIIPSIPDDANTTLLIAGMVGTTMGGVLYVVRSILVKEKGWGRDDLKRERNDALVSVAVMFVLSIAVMAAAAGTLHPRGLSIESAIDMVRLLEPLAGRFAISVFVVGIVAGGLSSLFPIILLGPWLIADFNNTPRDLKTTQSRVIMFAVVLLGLIVPVFGGRPVLVMIVSQALLTVATPLIILLMLILQNRRSVLGEHRPSLVMNVTVVITLLFAIVMAGFGLVGIYDFVVR